jgi:DNA-binding NarL/FixJ family response regulator
MEIKYTVRVVIADDHELYLDGLKGFFLGNDVYEIVGEAYNGEELVSKVSNLNPHVVLTDLRMPLLTGAKAIRKMVRQQPDIKCIVLTSYENDFSIIEALEAGAKGYITKSMPKKDLFTALDQVCRGYPYYCLTTNAKLVRLLGKSHFNPYDGTVKLVFSSLEKKIITLICQEKDNKEMSEELFISIRTVENIRSRVYKKMEVKTPAGVAIYAIKNGLYFLGE